MSAADRERIEAKIEAAKAVLAEICKRAWAGQPALKWSIPARETDDDLVIADALSQLSALSEALSAAHSEIDRLEAESNGRLTTWSIAVAEKRELAEALTACQQERARFVCPDCGVVAVDEDGCCVTCGADCTVERVSSVVAQLRADLTACRAQGEARDRELAQMFSDGVDVARSYGDNAFHLHGEQLERQFQRALARMRAGEGQNVQPRAALSSTPTEPKNEK